MTYVYTDLQGTPLVHADAQGNIIARYDYTPYGNAVASLGNPPDGPGYTGHVYDPESGLVYMQQRYYQPDGRFLSPDPVRPIPGDTYSFNRYSYVDGNPIRKTDPTGMFQCANKSSCDAGMRLRWDFQKALKNFKMGSSAYKAITAGIKALGTANDGGAIHVSSVINSAQPSLGWGRPQKVKRQPSP